MLYRKVSQLIVAISLVLGTGFTNHALTNECATDKASGDTYVGDYVNGMKHGQGIYTWANGDKYVGEYMDDKKHGLGKLTFVRGDGGIKNWENINKGRWVGDSYVLQGIFADDGLGVEMSDIEYANALAKKAQTR